MARFVAGHDYDKAVAIGRWPVLELLESFDQLDRDRILNEYRHAAMIYAASYPNAFAKNRPKPPRVPKALRGHG
jgi:hypothetical protein